MTSELWLLHGWRIRYCMRELCFLLSWNLHQLTRSDSSPPRLVSTWDAEWAIRMSAGTRDYWSKRVIEEMYLAVTRRTGLPSFSRRDLERHMLSTVLHAVESGQLVAVEVERPSPPPCAVEPEPKAKYPSEPPPPATFELQVVLDSDSTPITQLRLELKSQDERDFRNFATDGNGWIRVEHSPQNSTEVRAPRGMNGVRIEDCAVVVGWGVAPIEKEATPKRDRPARPPIRRLVGIDEHHVRNGDTRASVAARAKMSWADLAYFNWGTRVPEEVDKHLLLEVGCRNRGGDGGLVFTDADKPGVIMIPRPFSYDGLSVGIKNVLRVKQLERRPFEVEIVSDEGLPIPDAQFDAELADGRTVRGVTNVHGKGIILNPPTGQVAVRMVDPGDVLAKALAAATRKGFSQQELRALFRMLQNSPSTVNRAVQAYDTYFDDYTGEGFLRDVDFIVTDPDARRVVDGLLVVAGFANAGAFQRFGWRQQDGERTWER